MISSGANSHRGGLLGKASTWGRRWGCLRPQRTAIQPCATNERVSTAGQTLQESEAKRSSTTAQKTSPSTQKSAQSFTDVVAAFWKLSSEQKLSVAIGGVILVFLVPKLALVGLAGVERALIGGIIALETMLVSVFRYLLTGALGVGIVGFVLLSMMAFLFPKQKK